MIEIKGTTKIKGVLDLQSIKRQMKSTDVAPITGNDFWNADIQIALKMGYITSSGESGSTKMHEVEPDRLVNLVNNTSTPLNVPGQSHAVSGGAQFTMKESEIRDPNVKMAISKGLIKVLSVVKNEEPSEGFIKLDDSFIKHEEPIYQEPKKEDKPAVKRLDTNEELPEPKKERVSSNFIDTDTPAPVEARDIHDPLGQSVIFNPTGAKPINVLKNTHAVDSDSNSELDFVDQEQLKEKLSKHPKLKPELVEDTLIMVDLEDAGSRKNKNIK